MSLISANLSRVNSVNADIVRLNSITAEMVLRNYIEADIKQIVFSGGEGPDYDADAQDYFDRVYAKGGDFDCTSVNQLYTEEYTKTSINTMILDFKSAGILDLDLDISMFNSASFEGLTEKLLYTNESESLLYNFTSADYIRAGSGAGLKGDGVSKYGSLQKQVDLSLSGMSALCYVTESQYEGGSWILYTAYRSFGLVSVGGTHRTWNQSSNAVVLLDVVPKMFMSNSVFGSKVKAYTNSQLYGSSPSIVEIDDVVPYDVDFYRDGSTGGNKTNSRCSIMSFGDSMTEAQAIALQTAMNAHATRMGFNTY